MDFDSLISVAENFSSKNKVEAQVKRYNTDVTPAKKPPKSNVQSEAVKAFLRKKQLDEEKKKVEALKEKERLLELRSAAKHNRRASNMARRTKDNNFGINFQKLLQEKEEKELADAVAAAVGASGEEPSVEKRRRRRKVLSDEGLERDLGSLGRTLALKSEDHDRRNGGSYPTNSYKNARDSTSVPHRPSSDAPAPSRGVKRPAPPPDFFSLLKIAKTKQFEPVEITTKKRVETDDDRPMTKEERQRHLTEKEYLAAKEARSKQKQIAAARGSSSGHSDNSHRPPQSTGFKIPKTKSLTKTEPLPPISSSPRDTSEKSKPSLHSSSKKNPPIQNNIANQLNAKVTKFPSSFTNNNKVPHDDNDRRKSQHSTPSHRSSAPNGLSRSGSPKPTKPTSGPPDAGRHSSGKDHARAQNGISRTDPPKPTKSSAGPPDAGRHSSSNARAQNGISRTDPPKSSKSSSGPSSSSRDKDYAGTKGPTSSKPPPATIKKDLSERLQNGSASLKSSGDSAMRQPARNPFSTPARSKSNVRVAPISTSTGGMSSRPGARPDAASRLSDQKDKLVRPSSAGRPDSGQVVQGKPKAPLSQGSAIASSKQQPRQEVRKVPQGQDVRRPLSAGQEVRKPTPGLEARKTASVQGGRPVPPNKKTQAGQEVKRVPPGQDVRRVPPSQDVRRVLPGQDVRRPPPGQDVRRPPPGQDVRRPPPGQDVRRPPPGQDVRRPPPGQDVRRPPPGKEVRRVPSSQEVRRRPPVDDVRTLPPTQELRRLPSGQFVRRTLPSNLPPMSRNPAKRRIESDEEDEDMDDFIDDGPVGEPEDVSKYIREIFGYDKRRFIDEPDDDDVMETSFAQQMKEEARSTRAGLLEDLEDIRKEQEEKNKAKKKKKS